MERNFYETKLWDTLRKHTFKTQGYVCMKCGATNTILQSDHIYPIADYPQLKTSRNNLQVLCKPCNLDKSNLYAEDFRVHPHNLARYDEKQRKRILRSAQHLKEEVEFIDRHLQKNHKPLPGYKPETTNRILITQGENMNKLLIHCTPRLKAECISCANANAAQRDAAEVKTPLECLILMGQNKNIPACHTCTLNSLQGYKRKDSKQQVTTKTVEIKNLNNIYEFTNADSTRLVDIVRDVSLTEVFYIGSQASEGGWEYWELPEVFKNRLVWSAGSVKPYWFTGNLPSVISNLELKKIQAAMRVSVNHEKFKDVRMIPRKEIHRRLVEEGYPIDK